MLYKLIAAGIIIFLSGSFKTNGSVKGTSKIKEQAAFFVYNFGGLEKYSPEEQVGLVSNIGYNGMAIYATTAEDVEKIPRFIYASARKKNFKIYAVFVRYNFQDSEIDRNRWKDVIKKIEGKGINLWFIFGEKRTGVTDLNIETVLKEVVDTASLHGVPVTLYPHSLCYIASAEQALPFVKKMNNPNLKLAVHLCHEIRAGNGARISDVIKKVKGYISFATLSGTDSTADFSSLYRMDTTTIKPLDRGNYDVKKFLRALKSVHYNGPIGFINFKINEEPKDYLSRSLVAWNKMKDEVFK